jgi:hypothetical protein
MNITFKEALEKARTFSYQNKDLENKNDDTNHPNKKSRIEVIYDNNKLPERYIDEMPAYYGMKTSNKFEKKKKQKVTVSKKKDKEIKEQKETKEVKLKAKTETKNSNYVFNNYYEEEEPELILDFD